LEYDGTVSILPSRRTNSSTRVASDSEPPFSLGYISCGGYSGGCNPNTEIYSGD